jgi:hypothetical protein
MSRLVAYHIEATRLLRGFHDEVKALAKEGDAVSQVSCEI